MEENILNSIKKLLGIPEDYTAFDQDIMIHINSVFMILSELGVGPSNGYSLKDGTEKWGDFISDDENLEGIKTYIYMKVKTIFDPPLNSAVLASMKELISEFEWRINNEAEGY
jgi:hypothetical protein